MLLIEDIETTKKLFDIPVPYPRVFLLYGEFYEQANSNSLPEPINHRLQPTKKP